MAVSASVIKMGLESPLSSCWMALIMAGTLRMAVVASETVWVVVHSDKIAKYPQVG